MERYTIDVRDDALSPLRDAADARGVSVEEEISALVQRTYTKRTEDDWVHELIAMTRPGFDENPFAPERVNLARDPFGAG